MKKLKKESKKTKLFTKHQMILHLTFVKKTLKNMYSKMLQSLFYLLDTTPC